VLKNIIHLSLWLEHIAKRRVRFYFEHVVDFSWANQDKTDRASTGEFIVFSVEEWRSLVWRKALH